MISISFTATLYGLISGILWSFALGFPLKNGLFYGAIIGIVAGFIFYRVQKNSTKSGNINDKEALTVTSTLMAVIFFITIAIGIIAGLINWLFF